MKTSGAGLLGVAHQTARGWEPQPSWLSDLLRISESVAESASARRRAVIITPHPSPIVALMVAHLAVRRFESQRLPDRWWEHDPAPRAAVRLQAKRAELLLFRKLESSNGRESLRFGTAKGTRLMVSVDRADELVPIPFDVLPDPERAKLLDLGNSQFAGVLDLLGPMGIPYVLGTDSSVTVVGRKDETRSQLEGNSVRDADGGVATLAALARVKELAHANSFRSRWISPDAAAAGEADEGSMLILNGGAAMMTAMFELEEHPWIAVLDRSSPSVGEAVSQVEQYYFSVDTERIDTPEGIDVGRSNEILLFQEAS